MRANEFLTERRRRRQRRAKASIYHGYPYWSSGEGSESDGGGLGEGSDQRPQRGIRYSGTPNLAAEWDEAERYPEFQKWGHEAWFDMGNRGRVVRWSQLGEVGNHEPNLNLLEPEKVRRVQTEVLRDEIDYPIVGRWPDGYLDLIAGNTRVAVLLSQGYDPRVWLIDIPEDSELNENFHDGRKPGRRGLSRRVGIPKNATLAQLEKIASSSTGERRRMAQWQLNMRRGRNKEKT
jgi:hypothetical protein